LGFVDPQRTDRHLDLIGYVGGTMKTAVSIHPRQAVVDHPPAHHTLRLAKSLLTLPIALPLVMALAAAIPLEAQTVQGIVKDAGSGLPIADASVTLLDDRGRVQRGNLTEPDGSFVIVAPKKGKYTLRVGAAGYKTTDSPEIELKDDVVEEISIMLTSEGETGPPGFEARRQRGGGEFLTREQIENLGATMFTDLLQFVPGVDLVPLPIDTTLVDRDEVERGGRAGYRTVRIKPDRGNPGARQTLEPSLDCVPVLFGDGAWWGPVDGASEAGPDGKFVPNNIEAIEIYNHPSVLPDQFNSGKEAMDCGVIVLWMKTG
jgi:hypothetical protein